MPSIKLDMNETKLVRGFQLFVFISPEDVRLRPIFVRNSSRKGCDVVPCITDVAVSGKNASPAFDIAVLDTSRIHEEMGKVFDSVNTEGFAGLYNRVIKCGDFRPLWCYAEKPVHPADDKRSYGILSLLVGGCRIRIVQEPHKGVVMPDEIVASIAEFLGKVETEKLIHMLFEVLKEFEESSLSLGKEFFFRKHTVLVCIYEVTFLVEYFAIKP